MIRANGGVSSAKWFLAGVDTQALYQRTPGKDLKQSPINPDSWPDSEHSELAHQTGTVDSRNGTEADIQKITRMGGIQGLAESSKSHLS